VLLNVVLFESNLKCQGSNIFSSRPLSTDDRVLPEGGVHFNVVNATNRYP
jgi:hypothetical protein